MNNPYRSIPDPKDIAQGRVTSEQITHDQAMELMKASEEASGGDSIKEFVRDIRDDVRIVRDALENFGNLG